MKPKTLYAFFAAAVIIILISIWINRESVKIQPLLQEEDKTRQALPLTQPQPLLSGELQPVSNNKPSSAITIIKPPLKQEPVSRIGQIEEKITKNQQPEGQVVTSTQEPAVFEEGEEADNLPGEPTSGVTKINKRPTEEENKEMNAQGIVMY